MLFTQFQHNLNNILTESDIKTQTQYYGTLIQESTDGAIFVDRKLTCFLSLDEAKQSLQYDKIKENIEQELQKELYENIPNTKVAEFIKEHHEIKLTDTLIESYKELASSKLFTLDPVVYDIRNFNKHDRILESKLDFVLDDGSSVLIDEDTFIIINNILNEHSDVIEYMRESKENFMSVIEQLEG